jgi:hypothetical protein
LAGRTVYLDANDNRIFDAGDVSTTSYMPQAQETSNYTFTGLGATNYVVRLAPLEGETVTSPPGNIFTAQSLTTGANAIALVAGDFNLDGRMDLATADNASDRVSVRFQQASGSFGDAVINTLQLGSQPSSIAIGKFNNDALPDIAVVHQNISRIVLLMNNGNGTFTKSTNEIAIPVGIYASIVAANFDNDVNQLDDIAVAVDGVQDKLAIRINNGVGGFTSLADISLLTAPLAIAAGTLDSDSFPDIVVGNFDVDKVQVFRNISGTSFTGLTAIDVGDGPSSIAIADINGDLRNDVLVANIGTNGISTLINTTIGTNITLSNPTPLSVDGGPRAVTAGDIDGDGDVDIIVGTSTTDDVVVLRNVGGTFAFAESTGFASFAGFAGPGVKGVLVRDIDGDGLLDVAAARGDFSSGSLTVLENEEAGGSYRLKLTGFNIVNDQNFGISAPLPGDYDRNGLVQTADYTFWRGNFGATTGMPLNADGNGNNVVDAADFVIWRNHVPPGAGGSAVAQSSSEPASFEAETNAPVIDESAAAESFSTRDAAAKLVVAFDEAYSALEAKSWRLPRTVRAVNDGHSAVVPANILGNLLLTVIDRKPAAQFDVTEPGAAADLLDEASDELDSALAEVLGVNLSGGALFRI